MTRFSRRYKFDPKIPNRPIETDAPSFLRIGFLRILDRLTYIDGDSRYSNPDCAPIGVKALIEELAVLFGQEVGGEAYDSWQCESYLSQMVKECEWYQFYDCVEKIGGLLKEAEKRVPYDPEWLARYGFTAYREKVNELMRESAVIWRLDDSGLLRRDTPEVLRSRLTRTENRLSDGFEPARVHYRKAQRFLDTFPGDPENAIKEIVSAVESVGKTLYPGTDTLGDVIKELKKLGDAPSLLAEAMTKFWAYANSEPAVRHGGTVLPQVRQADAELCFHIGVAFIRYLIEVHNQKTRGT